MRARALININQSMINLNSIPIASTFHIEIVQTERELKSTEITNQKERRKNKNKNKAAKPRQIDQPPNEVKHLEGSF